MIKRFILTVILMNLSILYAQTIKADFKVEFGIVGEIGIANAVLSKHENSSYEIRVKLKATGIADILSGGRTEEHISKGRIKEGMLISDYYQVTKSHGSKMTTKLYRIDHEDKKVFKSYQRWEKGKQTVDENTSLDYYAQDDLLSLYFNLHQKIVDKTTAKKYAFMTVGAEKRQGKVTVLIPKQEELENYEEALGKNKNSWYAGAIIYQDIFSSKQGELLLKIDDNGLTEKAVLKDLILFGDIRAKRIN